jgi:hypothetical protein
MTDVAARPENTALVAEFTQKLGDHLRRTARRPGLFAQAGDLLMQIDALLKSDDIRASERADQ